MQQWFDSPPGAYLLAWEQASADRLLADVFGYHALQVGQCAPDLLRANRMPHRWLGLEPGAQAGARAPDFLTDTHTLPFDAASLDLVVLPHTLELSVDPHATLREVERVLVPEGRVVISGFNPASLWGWRQQRAHWLRRLGLGQLFLPERGEFIAYWRLREWLRLLSFEVESARFGAYRPALADEKWLSRMAWMDRIGQRWWPILGAAYFVVAIKRVPGVRLIEPAWRRRAPAAAPGATVMPLHGRTPGA